MKSIIALFVFLFMGVAQASYSDQALKTIKSLKSNYIEHDKYKNHFYSLESGKKVALIIVTGVAEPVIQY